MCRVAEITKHVVNRMIEKNDAQWIDSITIAKKQEANARKAKMQEALARHEEAVAEWTAHTETMKAVTEGDTAALKRVYEEMTLKSIG